MPERELRQRIRHALQRAFPDALVIGWPANAWTGAGWPDLLFWQFPALIGLEVKQGRRSKPTPLQAARHTLLRNHSIPVCITHTPEGAVAFVKYWKEYITMAFDPDLLAELNAALGVEPEPAPVAEPAPVRAKSGQVQLTPEERAAFAPEPEPEPVVEPETPFGAAAVLSEDPDALANGTEQPAVFEVALDEPTESEWYLLRKSIDSLTMAIVNLIRELHEDGTENIGGTVEAPAPRRRGRPRA